MVKYPKEIYVTEQDDGHGPYFLVNSSPAKVAEPDQSVEVAVYALVGVGTVQAPVQLQAAFKTTMKVSRKK